MDYECIGMITFDKVASSNIYLYGSTIKFEDSQVSLTNIQLPPSRPLFSWRSRYNYQGDRRSPELPLLIPNKKYRLDLEIETVPNQSFYVKITFMNRQGDMIETYIQREGSKIFTCPEETFSYNLQIFGAGCEMIVFKRMYLYQKSFSQTIQLEEENLVSNMYYTDEFPESLELIKPIVATKERKEDNYG